MNVSPSSDHFVDTNILVYAYDLSARRKHTEAAHLMEGWWEEGNGCLSIQVLQEFYVCVTQKITLPLDYHIARQIVADLANWRIHIPQPDDLLQAIDLQRNYQCSFWDAMIIQSAVRLGCKQIYSEDLSHGQSYGSLQVVNPFMGIESRTLPCPARRHEAPLVVRMRPRHLCYCLFYSFILWHTKSDFVTPYAVIAGKAP